MLVSSGQAITPTPKRSSTPGKKPRKSGVEQEFTLQDYPRGDSSWHFVDQQSKLIKKGYEPPIHDFELINYEGEDLTYDLLEEEHVTLVVMYDLQKADLNQLPKLAQLCKVNQQEEQPVYILTSATDEQIEDFIAQHDDVLEEAWREIFLTADGIMLKTIVRANPGVLVINNGTIIDKYNLRDRSFAAER